MKSNYFLKLSGIIFLLLSVQGLLAADRIILKNYDVIEGKVSRISNEGVELETTTGKKLIPQSDIARIIYEDGQTLDMQQQMQSTVQNQRPVAENQSEEISRHDYFFLRLLYGLGYTNSQAGNEYLYDENLSGPGGMAGIQIGGSPVSYHALFFEYSLGVALPDTEVASNIGYEFIGLGYSYYLKESNIHFDISVGMPYWYNFYTGETNLGKDPIFVSGSGQGIHLVIGKEWFVSKNWGIGVQVYYQYANMPASGKEPDVENYIYDSGEVTWQNIGIALTATYN